MSRQDQFSTASLFQPDARVFSQKFTNLSFPTGFFSEKSLDSLIVEGDSISVLEKLPNCVAQSCVTSPPYWSLRDYGIQGQIGLEKTLDDYITKLVNVFREVRRVLKDDGTLWLNIGDTYTSGGRSWRASDKKNPVRAMSLRPATPEGLKAKDLIGVPWRVAFALQNDGWYLRTEIIWNKPNCQPESVKDRPTRSHEYIFLFSKSEQYMYDASAVRGPNDRNLRSVWDINTRALREAHIAAFPLEIVTPSLQLCTRLNDIVIDPFIGSGTTGVAAYEIGRRFLGVELNPVYVEIAERRMNGALVKQR